MLFKWAWSIDYSCARPIILNFILVFINSLLFLKLFRNNPCMPTVDISTLERLAQEFFARGLAAKTVATYGSAQLRYLTFCEAAGVTPLPLSEGVLCLFVVFLAHQGLAHQSITAYLSGVRNLAIANGDTPVDRDQMPCLQLVLRGVVRSPNPRGGTYSRLPLLVQLCIS